jgi:hypothetical protein
MVGGEQLRELLAGGVGRESNIVSVLVETVTRLVVQELLEAAQADYLGGRGWYERRQTAMTSTCGLGDALKLKKTRRQP